MDLDDSLLWVSLLLLLVIVGSSWTVCALQGREGEEGFVSSEPSTYAGWAGVYRYYANPAFMDRIHDSKGMMPLENIAKQRQFIPGRPKAAFAMRRAVRDYMGPTFRLRRKNGSGDEVDVYMDDIGTVAFIDGGGSTQDMQTWANGQPLQMTAWYDQSGNRHHMRMIDHPLVVREDDGRLCVHLDGNTQYGICDGILPASRKATAAALGIAGDSPKTVVALAKPIQKGSLKMGLFDVGSRSENKRFCMRTTSGADYGLDWLADFGSQKKNIRWDQEGGFGEWHHYTLAHSGGNGRTIVSLNERPLASHSPHQLDTDGGAPLRFGGLSSTPGAGQSTQVWKGRVAGLAVLDVDVPQGVNLR